MKRDKELLGRTVLVTWQDAHSAPAWVFQGEAEEQDLVECKSVGWLLRWDSRIVTLAASTYPADGGGMVCGDVLSVPAACVTSIQVLELE